jgi:triosephosphate isomerase
MSKHASPFLLIANWKSHKTLEEGQQWLTQFASTVQQIGSSSPDSPLETVLCPSYPFLCVWSKEELRSASLALGAQDVSHFPLGGYTGAVAAETLASFGVRYVLVGHSERRRYFRESTEDVVKKVEYCIVAGMTPIVCVDDHSIHEVLQALQDAPDKVCFAYEPVAAIGSGNPDAPEHVVSVVERLHVTLPNARVLYGGSITDQNVASYVRVCDGLLVGGASLEAQQFASLHRRCVSALSSV